MTYDNWKAHNPADAELGEEIAQCEICRHDRPLGPSYLVGPRGFFGRPVWCCEECELRLLERLDGEVEADRDAHQRA